MEKPYIIKVLEDAQLAHQAGDFVNALKFYQHFFDHALDDDPYALYGVRLSYCLEGWAKLANEFMGAKNALEQKQQESLDRYLSLRQPERFHDYYVISLALAKPDQALQKFFEINNVNPQSAAKLIKFVWEDLVKGEHWQVCNQFLEDPVKKLDESFAVFDESSRMSELDSAFANPEFEQHILNELINSSSELILVLRHNSRMDDVEVIQRKFFEIAHARDHSGLNKLIQAQGSFLFGGH